MENKVVYLIIGGPPTYHCDDQRIREIYGVYSDRKKAEQCYNQFVGSCGEIYFLTVPLDERPSPMFDGLDISLFSENVPTGGFDVEESDEFSPVYVVTFESRKDGPNLVYKICSKEKSATLTKKRLEPSNLAKYMKSLEFGEIKVNKYWIRDLPSLWKGLLTEDMIDKYIEPIEYKRSDGPIFSRW